MKKRLICMIAVFALAAALTVPAAAVYSDVKGGDWYETAVNYCLSHGFMTGTSETAFEPNGPVDLGLAVLLLHRLAGSPAPKGSSAFTDVPAGADYAGAVAWAVERGVTTGTGGGAFSPEATCTRGQIVTFLHRDLAR